LDRASTISDAAEISTSTSLAKQELGDQRIDLVFAPSGGQAVLPIHRKAEETGVLL
jgi:hypothetical protein